jgi:hypothetical protein
MPMELKARLLMLPVTPAAQRATLRAMHRAALRDNRTPGERAIGLMQAATIRNRIRRIKP